MADLPTNYHDDILSASMNGKKKFRLTYRNGTTEEVTIEDISEYDQYGSKFGAGDINKTNQAVNEKFDSGDVVDPMLTTEPGFAADAYQTKLQFDAQNKKLETKTHTLCDNAILSKSCNVVELNLSNVPIGTLLNCTIPEEYRPKFTISNMIRYTVTSKGIYMSIIFVRTDGTMSGAYTSSYPSNPTDFSKTGTDLVTGQIVWIL